MARKNAPRYTGIAVPARQDPEGLWFTENGNHELRFGALRIVVHHHIHYPPETWFVTCDAVRVGSKELRSTDLNEAKMEAFSMVETIVRGWVAKMDDHGFQAVACVAEDARS